MTCHSKIDDLHGLPHYNFYRWWGTIQPPLKFRNKDYSQSCHTCNSLGLHCDCPSKSRHFEFSSKARARFSRICVHPMQDREQGDHCHADQRSFADAIQSHFQLVFACGSIASWRQYRSSSVTEPQKASVRTVGIVERPTNVSATFSQTSRNTFSGRTTQRRTSLRRRDAASGRLNDISAAMSGRAMPSPLSCKKFSIVEKCGMCA